MHYFRGNWGAPFVLAFMVLLLASAAESSMGSSAEADGVAVYAFYSLAIGVVLQIASYIRYGEARGEEQDYSLPPPGVFHWTRRRALAVGVVALVAVGAGAAVLYPRYSTSGVTSSQTYPRLTLSVGFVEAISEPDGSTVVSFGINAAGGSQPYNFTARWGDDFTQSVDTGVFLRTFAQSGSIPSSALVSVASSDGQVASIEVDVSNSTGTTFHG